MKKIIVAFTILLVLLVVLYLSGNYVLNQTAAKFTDELLPKLEKKGVNIDTFSYGDISIHSPKSIKVKDIDLTFRLTKEEFGNKSYSASFQAAYVIIRINSFSDLSGTFSINDFSIFIEPDDKRTIKPFGKINNGYFQCRIPFSLHRPEEDANKILLEVERLFNNNTARNLELSGDVQVGIDGKEAVIGLTTIKHSDSVSLRFNIADIITASRQYELELTEKEAAVIAHYPNKVPIMLRITREARQKSEQRKLLDSAFPEDAFRHIYWSYHLTRALGPTLSKEITDAHETAPGNTKQERLMDYHNNEVGRNLALQNLTENQLLELVLTSDKIIRDPGKQNVR